MNLVVVLVLAFVYIELAIGFGYYMYTLTSNKTPEVDKAQQKQIKIYSIIAGVAFPVTFAVIMASKVAERR